MTVHKASKSGQLQRRLRYATSDFPRKRIHPKSTAALVDKLVEGAALAHSEALMAPSVYRPARDRQTYERIRSKCTRVGQGERVCGRGHREGPRLS